LPIPGKIFLRSGTGDFNSGRIIENPLISYAYIEGIWIEG
jgi:hypothetical protein